MRLLQPAFAAAALALAFAGDAAAQNAAVIDATKPPATSPLRYRFSHVADGVMRLDHQTGQVVFCKSQAGKWLCNAVPEEGEVLKAQLAQAEDGNSKLVDQLGEMQKQLAMPAEERAALKDAIEKAQAESAAARTEIKNEFAALRDEISALKQRLSGSLTEPALKEAVEKAQAESTAARNERRSEITALREDIAGLKQQLSGNQTEQTLKAEIARIRTGNEALAGDLTAKLAEMRKDIAAIAAQVTAQKELEAQRAATAKLQAENKALNDRIAALQDETAALQRRITDLEPPRPPAPVPNTGESKAPQMPTKEDLAAARARIAEAWRRVVEMLNDLRRDLTGKNDDESVRL